MTNLSGMAKTAQEKTAQQTPPATLGDVLYATPKPSMSEEDWVAVVRSIAAGNQMALYALYGRAHRIVFTLAMRLTANRETAEDVTIEVFHEIWRGAAEFDPANGTVLGWIMNQARARALDRREIGDRQADAQTNGQAKTLCVALAALTPDERQTIEATFFDGLTHVEAAERLNQPLETIKARICSGLHKLRRTLGVKRGDDGHV